MGIVKTSDVFCDVNGRGCQIWTPGGASLTDAQARKAAEDSGWIYRRASTVNGKRLPAQDVCPECQGVECAVSTGTQYDVVRIPARTRPPQVA